MNKQESTHDGPQFMRPGGPIFVPEGGPYQKERHPSYDNNLSMSSAQSPGYKHYGDPAASPLATPGYGNPLYGSHVSVKQQRPNFPTNNSYDQSYNNTPNRGSQVYPPANREDSFNPNQSHTSASFPGAQDSFSSHTGDPRVQSNGHQQQPLKDGFVSDSARNSLSHSDSSRSGPNSYNPVQTERRRLQQQLGHPPGDSQQQRDQIQRDSYSDTDDNRVKQLSKWDQNFPSIDEEHLKHSSFDDLLDGRKGKLSGLNNTFNTRSKSHENFSRLPGSQQHINTGDQLLSGQTAKAGPFQQQDAGRRGPGGGQQQAHRDGQNYHGPRPAGASQGLPSQHSSPYQPHREFQSPLQDSYDTVNSRGSLRDNR